MAWAASKGSRGGAEVAERKHKEHKDQEGGRGKVATDETRMMKAERWSTIKKE